MKKTLLEKPARQPTAVRQGPTYHQHFEKKRERVKAGRALPKQRENEREAQRRLERINNIQKDMRQHDVIVHEKN